jgi:hypothetical protein
MSDERKSRPASHNNAEKVESQHSGVQSTTISSFESGRDILGAVASNFSNTMASHVLSTSQPPSVMSFQQIQNLMDNEILPDEAYTAQREDDVDSAYGTELSIGEDTMTLASFITDYRYENGRRYHSYRDGSYWGPNDESGITYRDPLLE